MTTVENDGSIATSSAYTVVALKVGVHVARTFPPEAETAKSAGMPGNTDGVTAFDAALGVPGPKVFAAITVKCTSPRSSTLSR